MRSAPEYKEGKFAEKRGYNDKEEPQTPEPGRLLDEAGKTKNRTDQTDFARSETTEKGTSAID